MCDSSTFLLPCYFFFFFPIINMQLFTTHPLFISEGTLLICESRTVFRSWHRFPLQQDQSLRVNIISRGVYAFSFYCELSATKRTPELAMKKLEVEISVTLVGRG